MNLRKLFSMQETLDKRIHDEHNPSEALLIDNKLLSLLVELGELANETRCFKYWSKKGPSEREVILEEFVDGLHFILSIGISKGYKDIILENTLCCNCPKELTLLFLDLYSAVNAFAKDQCNKNYSHIFNNFLILGKALSFSESEIEAAYVSKNEVNHQRQDEGY